LLQGAKQLRWAVGSWALLYSELPLLWSKRLSATCGISCARNQSAPACLEECWFGSFGQIRIEGCAISVIPTGYQEPSLNFLANIPGAFSSDAEAPFSEEASHGKVSRNDTVGPLFRGTQGSIGRADGD
jgi:hypothetical protein